MCTDLGFENLCGRGWRVNYDLHMTPLRLFQTNVDLRAKLVPAGCQGTLQREQNPLVPFTRNSSGRAGILEQGRGRLCEAV